MTEETPFLQAQPLPHSFFLNAAGAVYELYDIMLAIV